MTAKEEALEELWDAAKVVTERNEELKKLLYLANGRAETAMDGWGKALNSSMKMFICGVAFGIGITLILLNL